MRRETQKQEVLNKAIVKKAAIAIEKAIKTAKSSRMIVLKVESSIPLNLKALRAKIVIEDDLKVVGVMQTSRSRRQIILL